MYDVRCLLVALLTAQRKEKHAIFPGMDVSKTLIDHNLLHRHVCCMGADPGWPIFLASKAITPERLGTKLPLEFQNFEAHFG